MYFNGVDMYFQKNIFGDVIAIYNSIGVLQGRYTYDAWGKITRVEVVAGGIIGGAVSGWSA